MSQPVEVPFVKWIEDGFILYKSHFATLVLAALIMLALSTLTLLILLPPLTAGIILLTLRLADGETPPPGAGAVFNGFSVFFNALLFMLIWGGVTLAGVFLMGWFPVIGQLAALFFSYSIQALLVFGMFLIADRRIGFWEASTQSMNIVKTNFWPFLGLTIVASVIGGIGAIAFGIGVIFTLPMNFCILAVAYRDVCKAAGTDMAEVKR